MSWKSSSQPAHAHGPPAAAGSQVTALAGGTTDPGLGVFSRMLVVSLASLLLLHSLTFSEPLNLLAAPPWGEEG